MASNTKISESKRRRRQKNSGHQRKVAMSKQSTVSYDTLFAACGEPGKPAPKPS